ncbi:hypothetical protein PENTCL1PPCAC_6713 [Pristionchus entomophagus]|uniref:Uncharacterized protein n=1 Tax=Pristionchus entomophagus TaxID=358040 RepID=A0AAV5SV80_9BILA|nr:hypothetical protein PENTCL1PPCAC_6713 [Pristionchus entomophagus]
MSFDMSFGDGAGWGGDTSFATETSGKDSESSKLADRLPIPAQIALLATLSEDKVVFGSMMFSSAHTIGDLAEVIGEGQNKQFKLADPQDPSSTFTVMAYGIMADDGSSGGNSDDFPIGTRVMVAGKLRSFDGLVSMLTFKIRTLEHDLEYDCFVKEAEIAKLYWEKNVPTLLRNGETSLDGIAAGRPVPREGGGGGVAPSMSAASVTRTVSSSAASHRPATAAPLNKQFGDVRDKVLDCLKEQARVSSETGNDRKVRWIRIGREVMNNIEGSPYGALEFLSQEGTIYCTVDDEHYETV